MFSKERDRVAACRSLSPQESPSDYYRCVEDYFETFIRVYEEYFSRLYGFWRPYIEQVIYRYLDAACPVPDTGATRTTVLPVSNAKTAITNICWH